LLGMPPGFRRRLLPIRASLARAGLQSATLMRG
jgi:hypothetical protein